MARLSSLKRGIDVLHAHFSPEETALSLVEIEGERLSVLDPRDNPLSPEEAREMRGLGWSLEPCPGHPSRKQWEFVD